MVPYRLSLTHTNFAAQLESVGLWHWAVFVLLHIEDAEPRETSVRHLLARNCPLEPDEMEQEKEDFVVDKLLVPKEWFHEAKVMIVYCCWLIGFNVLSLLGMSCSLCW